jgi:hypothetical protein
MTLHALKRRQVTEIYRVLERLVRFVAGLTLSIRQTTEIHGMLEVRHLR